MKSMIGTKALEDLMYITNVQSLTELELRSCRQQSSTFFTNLPVLFFQGGVTKKKFHESLYEPTAFTKQTPHAFLLIPTNARMGTDRDE